MRRLSRSQSNRKTYNVDRTSTVLFAQMTSVASLLRQRQEQKKKHKLGLSTDSLLDPPSCTVRKPTFTEPILRYNAAQDFEIARLEFWKPKIDSPDEAVSPPIRSPDSKSEGFFSLVTHENPSDNLFFQLAASHEIADQTLYEKFKRDYLAKRTEAALKKIRRNGRRRNRLQTRKSISAGKRSRKMSSL